MTTNACPHANLIEALHDGRLGPNEAASCERHLQTCAACAAHLQILRELRAALRASEISPTALEHQRARLALLRAAARGEAPRLQPKRRWTVAAGLLFAGSAMAGVTAWKAIGPQPPASTAVAPTPAPLASAAALPEPPPPHPAAPSAPRQPAPDVHPEAETAAPTPTPTPALSNEARHSLPVRPHRAALTPPKHSDAPERAAPTTAAPSVVLASDSEPLGHPELPAVSAASGDFAAAVAALGSGDFGVAAARFQAFSTTHASDPRSDEAAYLVAIALQRAGRADDAQAAAQRYLRDRPRGAHRVQAAKIAGPEAP